MPKELTDEEVWGKPPVATVPPTEYSDKDIWGEGSTDTFEEPHTDKPSTLGTVARSAGRNVAPGILAGEAALTAATALAPTAALTGGIPVIPAIGGGVAALGTYMGAKKLQTVAADYVAPDSFLGTKSEEADAEAHPIASTVGDLLGGGRPSISSAKNIVTALGTKAGREGVMQVGKSLLNKEASTKLVEAAKAAPEGLEAKAIENFNHALNAGTGVGLNTGIGIMQGADPLQTAGMGVAGLAFKPWAGRAAGIGGRGHDAESGKKTSNLTTGEGQESPAPEDIIPKTPEQQQEVDDRISKMLVDAEAPLTAAALSEQTKTGAEGAEASAGAEIKEPGTETPTEGVSQEPVAENMTVTPEATEEVPAEQLELPLQPGVEARVEDPNQLQLPFDQQTPVSDAATPQEPQIPAKQQFAEAGAALGALADGKVDTRTEFPGGGAPPEPTRDPNQLAEAFQKVAGTGTQEQPAVEPPRTVYKNTKMSVGFTSPNTGEGLTLDEAVNAMQSPQHVALRDFSSRVDEVEPGTRTTHNGIGSWADGQENTLVTEHRGDVDYEWLKSSEALKGAAGDQKAVGIFKRETGGKRLLFEFTIPKGTYEQATEMLRNAGVEHKTLIEAPEGVRVLVMGPEVSNEATAIEQKELARKLKQLTNENNYGLNIYKGRGEFVGSWDSRDEGREIYRSVLRGYIERLRDAAHGTDGRNTDSLERIERIKQLAREAGIDLDSEGVTPSQTEAAPEGTVPETPVAESQGDTVAGQQEQVPETPAGRPSQRAIAEALKVPKTRIKDYADRLGRPFESIDEAREYHEEWEASKGESKVRSLTDTIKAVSDRVSEYVSRLDPKQLRLYQRTMKAVGGAIDKDFGERVSISGKGENAQQVKSSVRGKLRTLDPDDAEYARQLAYYRFAEDYTGFLLGEKKTNPYVVGLGPYLRAYVNGKPTGIIPSAVARIAAQKEKLKVGDKRQFNEERPGKSFEDSVAPQDKEEAIQARGAISTGDRVNESGVSKRGVSDEDVIKAAQDKILSDDTPLEDRILGAALLLREGKLKGRRETDGELGQLNQMLRALIEMKGGQEALRKASIKARETSLREFATGEDWETLHSRTGQEDTSGIERGELVETTHAEGVLQRIVEDPKNDSMTLLVAKHLLKKFGRSGRLRSTPVDIHENLESGIAGEYNRRTGRIALEASGDAETALEEVLHSLTANKQLPREIKDLFAKIRDEAVRKGLTSEEQWTRAADPSILNKEEGDAFHYAFSNPHELLAAALKNREVRDALNNLEVRDSITGKLVKAWKQLKKAFKKMLGFRVKENSALDQYLNRMFDHMVERGETNALDTEGGNSVLYANGNENTNAGKESPKVGFVYRNGSTNRNSSLRGPEGIRRLAEATTANFRTGQGDRQTNESLAEGFRLLKNAVDAENLHINPTFFKRYVNPRTELADPGAEHSVYFDPQSGRVIKVTHADDVGDGNIGAKGPAGDYFTSLLLSKEMLGMDTHFEGLIDTGAPLPQIVTSQPRVGVRKATVPEIQADLKRKGFVKKDARKDANLWTHKKLGVDIYDAVPSNVLRDADGTMHYIDVDLIPKRPVADILADIQKAREEGKKDGKLNAIRINKTDRKQTTAFEEPVKKLSKDLQEAVKDTSYLPFTWKKEASHVSDWINNRAAEGATWEGVTMDLVSDAPVAGISDRQKMVGKVILTKSLDTKASELKRQGQAVEAARYQKIARTLFQSAKLDASLYGQGLNAVKMLSELISGNTVRGEYVDPIAKIHAEKLAGREEVADVLGTVKQGREEGAAAAVEKASRVIEKLAGTDKDPEAIKQVIKDALLNPDSTKESITAEVAEATGLPIEKITPAVEAISQAFTSESRKAVRAQLEKLVRAAAKKEASPKVKKIVESDTDKLLRLMGIGAFSEEKYYNAIAKSFDLPSWDPVFAKSLEVQGEKIAALPESMKDYRQQRTQNLMGEIAKKVRSEKLNNKDAGEIADLLTTFWQLGVLSGPPTQVVNAVASGISVLGESLVEGFAAARKTGDVRYITDVFHGFLQAITGKGGAQGLVGQEFSRAFKEGTSKFKNSKGETLSSMETLPDAKDLNGVMKAVSVYGNKLKYVGRSMQAFDAANMAMAERAAEMKATRYYLQEQKKLSGEELNAAMRDLFNPDAGTVDKFRAQALEEAAKGYYEGEDAAGQKRWIERRVNELLAQRRDQLTGGGISEQAIQAAERFTYNDDARGILGQFAGFMNQINQETKVSKFVISFMKTMMNLVNQTIDWSPYGALRAANKSFSQTRFKEGSRFDPYRYEEGSPEQYAQYARATLGTVALAGLAYLAYKGLEEEKEGKIPVFSIHGAGPSNPYDKQQLIATRNWQPNSVRIGNHWIRYTDIPGLGIALGGMGSFFDSQRYAKDDSTTQEKLFAGAMATASTVLDKNMLQGLSNLFDGIRQTNSTAQQANALKRLVSGTVGGFTNPGLARWARNSFFADKDGMVNRLDQSTNEGWLYSMVPFSIGYNTPALNTLGEPLQQPWYSATMWRFADVNGVPPHPIITPLVKAGLLLPNPSKNTEFRYVDKTGAVQKTRTGKYPEINRRYVELRGQAMKEMLTPEIIGDLSRAAKENVNEAQAYLDSKIGGAARKYAVARIEQEIQEGKLVVE